MQYLVFTSQAGNDNVEFSNLLEHAQDMLPCDANFAWRFRKLIQPGQGEVRHTVEPLPNPDGTKTFSRPQWVQPNTLFYSFLSPGYADAYNVNPVYKRMVEENRKSISVPISLNYFWETVDDLPFGNLLKTNTKSIYVYSTNIDRLIAESNFLGIENMVLHELKSYIRSTNPLDEAMLARLYPPGFDVMIDMDRIWTDWDYLNEKLTSIGITLSKLMYDRYLAVSGRG